MKEITAGRDRAPPPRWSVMSSCLELVLGHFLQHVGLRSGGSVFCQLALDCLWGPHEVTKVSEAERQKKSPGGRGSSEWKQLSDDAMTGFKMEERGPKPRDAGGLQKLRSECRRTERGVSRRQAASRDLDFSPVRCTADF